MAKTQEKDKTEKPKDPIVEKDLETKVDPIVDPDPADQEVEAIIEGKGHGPVGLLAPAYDVMYKGNFVHVTSEMLVKDPELLAYMRKEFPECFVK